MLSRVKVRVTDFPYRVRVRVTTTVVWVGI